ncbi:MAG: DUF6578 domain-containing protein [Candidatus Nanopelagicales bacterium]
MDRAEEHHGRLPDDACETIGTVKTIRGVQLRYETLPRGDTGMLYPVPGSARLTWLAHSHGDEFRWKGFVGYLVEIETLAPLNL